MYVFFLKSAKLKTSVLIGFILTYQQCIMWHYILCRHQISNMYMYIVWRNIVILLRNKFRLRILGVFCSGTCKLIFNVGPMHKYISLADLFSS